MIAQLEIPLDTVLYAMQLTHQANVLTVLNPAPAQPLLTELLSLIDLLIPNEIEAALLTGIEVKDEASAEQAARKLHERGAGVIVITLEERGAIVLDERGARRIPPFRVKAIDTTAAGDAFVAALAVAHAAGRDLDTALREANAAGALAATKRGAQPSLPTRAELDEFLKRARLKLVVRKFDHWDVRHRLIHLRIQLRTLVFHFARNHCAFHFHLAQDRIQYIDETWNAANEREVDAFNARRNWQARVGDHQCFRVPQFGDNTRQLRIQNALFFHRSPVSHANACRHKRAYPSHVANASGSQ